MALPKIEWTAAQDATIRRLRGDGETWDTISAALGISRYTVIRRADRIGARCIPREAAKPEPVNREARFGAHIEALPAGHPYTWGLLTKGTCLEGSDYVHALKFRQNEFRCNDFVAHANAITREVHSAPRGVPA